VSERSDRVARLIDRDVVGDELAEAIAAASNEEIDDARTLLALARDLSLDAIGLVRMRLAFLSEDK
jgi:hypothetical protein